MQNLIKSKSNNVFKVVSVLLLIGMIFSICFSFSDITAYALGECDSTVSNDGNFTLAYQIYGWSPDASGSPQALHTRINPGNGLTVQSDIYANLNPRVAIWSEENGQDDIEWKEFAPRDPAGNFPYGWYMDIDVSDHSTKKGWYVLHYYGTVNGVDTNLGQLRFYVNAAAPYKQIVADKTGTATGGSWTSTHNDTSADTVASASLGQGFGPWYSKVGSTITTAQAVPDYNGWFLNQGSTVTINASPDTGYKTTGYYYITLRDGAKHTLTNNQYTVIGDAVRIGATFAKADYTVTVASATGGAGKADKSTAQYGDKVTVTLTPQTGYSSAKPTVTGVAAGNVSGSGNTYTFTMPAQNVTVTPAFTRNAYNITVNKEGNGDVDASEKGTFGDKITITPNPDEGHEIEEVKLPDGTPVEPDENGNYIVEMPPGDLEVNVKFKPSTYKINLTVIGKGTAEAPETGVFDTEVEVTTAPDKGYKVNTVTADRVDENANGESSDNDENKNNEEENTVSEQSIIEKAKQILTRDADNTAKDEDKSENNEKGDVENNNEDSEENGEDENSSSLEVTIKEENELYGFVVPASDVDVVVNIVPIAYKVNQLPVSEGGSFTITEPDDDDGIKKIGDKIIITPKPDQGYQVKDVIVSPDVEVIKNEDGTYYFIMPDHDVDVEVIYETSTFKIITVENDNGTIEAPKEAKYKETVIFKPVPKEGYHVDRIILDPNVEYKDLGDGTYSFIMSPNDITIEVRYAKNKYKITVDNITNGKIWTDVNESDWGERIDIHYEAAAEYQLKEGSIKVNGTEVQVQKDSKGYYFIMPMKDAIITGEFEAVPKKEVQTGADGLPIWLLWAAGASGIVGIMTLLYRKHLLKF